MGSNGRTQMQVVMSWGGVPQGSLIASAGTRVMVGDAPDVAFLVPAELVPAPFALVDEEAGATVLRVPAGASARLTRSGEVEELPAASARTIAFDAGTTAEIVMGPLSFYVSASEPEAPLPLARPDFGSFRWVGASLALHGFFLVLFYFTPPSAGALSLDMSDRDREYVRIRLEAVEQAREEMRVESAQESGNSEGAPSPGEAGRVSQPEAPTRPHGGGIRAPGRSSDHRVPQTVAEMQNQGVVRAARLLAGMFNPVSSPYGAADAAGFSPDAAMSALMNGEPGIAGGPGGLSMIGSGVGGGCLPGQLCAAGAVGTGELATIGDRGPGRCTLAQWREIEGAQGRSAAVAQCSGGGNGPELEDTHRVRVPNTITSCRNPGDCRVVGGLTPDQIRRTISAQRNQVSFCYEQRLQARPDLAGRVSMSFMIQPDGSVRSVAVASSNIGDSQVEQCVAQTMSRLRFPTSAMPTGVTYPFVFQSTH